MLLVEGVTKTFGVGPFRKEKRAALDGIDVRVRSGSAYGFLGPNGAGKTTTIKILVGLIAQTSGRVALFGLPPSDRRARRRMGYLPENPALPDGLTGTEVLRLMGALSGVPGARIAEECKRVLRLVDMTHAAGISVRKYSKGMVQRLGLAQALLNDPEFVILDEPMSGLDPVGRRETKDLILELRRSGRTILFSTHIISDVEEICDDAAIIVRGKTVRSGSVNDLIMSGTRRIEILAKGVPENFGVLFVQTGAVSKFTVDKESDLQPLIERLWTSHAQLIAVMPIHYGLEDVFIEAIRTPAAADPANAEEAS